MTKKKKRLAAEDINLEKKEGRTGYRCSFRRNTISTSQLAKQELDVASCQPLNSAASNDALVNLYANFMESHQTSFNRLSGFTGSRRRRSRVSLLTNEILRFPVILSFCSCNSFASFSTSNTGRGSKLYSAACLPSSSYGSQNTCKLWTEMERHW